MSATDLLSWIPDPILEVLNFGAEYPDGDPDRMRALVAVLRTYADEIRTLSPELQSAVESALNYSVLYGELADTVVDQLEGLISGELSFQNVGAGIDDLGDFLDKAATQMEYEQLVMAIFAVITAYTVIKVLTLAPQWAGLIVPMLLAGGRRAIAAAGVRLGERLALLAATPGARNSLPLFFKEIIVPGLKSGGIMGLAGAGMDAGIQTYQIAGGNRQEFDTEQFFSTLVMWASGGMAGVSVAKQVERWLGQSMSLVARSAISGALGGAGGAVGMWTAGIMYQAAVQLAEKGAVDLDAIDWTLHKEMLIGGVVTGAAAGAASGMRSELAAAEPRRHSGGVNMAARDVDVPTPEYGTRKEADQLFKDLMRETRMNEHAMSAEKRAYNENFVKEASAAYEDIKRSHAEGDPIDLARLNKLHQDLQAETSPRGSDSPTAAPARSAGANMHASSTNAAPSPAASASSAGSGTTPRAITAGPVEGVGGMSSAPKTPPVSGGSGTGEFGRSGSAPADRAPGPNLVAGPQDPPAAAKSPAADAVPDPRVPADAVPEWYSAGPDSAVSVEIPRGHLLGAVEAADAVAATAAEARWSAPGIEAVRRAVATDVTVALDAGGPVRVDAAVLADGRLRLDITVSNDRMTTALSRPGGAVRSAFDSSTAEVTAMDGGGRIRFEIREPITGRTDFDVAIRPGDRTGPQLEPVLAPLRKAGIDPSRIGEIAAALSEVVDHAGAGGAEVTVRGAAVLAETGQVGLFVNVFNGGGSVSAEIFDGPEGPNFPTARDAADSFRIFQEDWGGTRYQLRFDELPMLFTSMPPGNHPVQSGVGSSPGPMAELLLRQSMAYLLRGVLPAPDGPGSSRVQVDGGVPASPSRMADLSAARALFEAAHRVAQAGLVDGAVAGGGPRAGAGAEATAGAVELRWPALPERGASAIESMETRARSEAILQRFYREAHPDLHPAGAARDRAAKFLGDAAETVNSPIIGGRELSGAQRLARLEQLAGEWDAGLAERTTPGVVGVRPSAATAAIGSSTPHAVMTAHQVRDGVAPLLVRAGWSAERAAEVALVADDALDAGKVDGGTSVEVWQLGDSVQVLIVDPTGRVSPREVFGEPGSRPSTQVFGVESMVDGGRRIWLGFDRAPDPLGYRVVPGDAGSAARAVHEVGAVLAGRGFRRGRSRGFGRRWAVLSMR